MTNATEELRALLDARGVEYRTIGKLTYWNRDGKYSDVDDADYVVEPNEGWLSVDGLTPEQAVDATLGRGECELVVSGTPCEGNNDVACTRCGAHNIYQVGYYDHEGHWREKFAHCPNCGKAVKR